MKRLTKFKGLAKVLVTMAVMVACISAFSIKDVSAAVTSAKVLNATTVVYTAVLDKAPVSEDGKVYLYELKTYEDVISPVAVPLVAAPASKNVSFKFDLLHKTPATRLYSKFVLAVKSGGVPVMVSTPVYITNPEALATHTKGRISLNKITQGEGMNNMLLTGSGSGPTASKPVVVLLAGNGSAVTHPLCAVPDTHPMVYNYCMLNAANAAGVNGLIADCTYQAANSAGQDFIIGNEVSERVWNYIPYTDWRLFVREYARAFRVCYTAIKSENANAKVYFSIGQNWDRNRPASHKEFYEYIDAKDFVDYFNAEIMAGGNIDWSVAIHPYTVPLTYSMFWNMSLCPDGAYCAQQVNSNKMVSFQNLSVMTNYLAKFKNPQGVPRTMIISEIGLSNTQGDVAQAAAIAASWVAYKKNPYISGYMYLNGCGDGVDSRLTGQALTMYNSLGTANEAAMLEWAKQVIGISDWNQILR